MYKSKEGGSIQMRNIVVQRQIVICKKCYQRILIINLLKLDLNRYESLSDYLI